MRVLVIPTLLGIVLFSNGSASRTTDIATSFQNTFNWRAQLAPGSAIELRGILGSIRAELASGNEVLA